jgi:hypothetical protein
VPPALVLVIGALATGAGATGCEAFEASLEATIVVTVPFTCFFCFVPIVCRASQRCCAFRGGCGLLSDRQRRFHFLRREAEVSENVGRVAERGLHVRYERSHTALQ